jgi:hypothetical protein
MARKKFVLQSMLDVSFRCVNQITVHLPTQSFERKEASRADTISSAGSVYTPNESDWRIVAVGGRRSVGQYPRCSMRGMSISILPLY